jgi:hypothetical protein
MTNKQFLNSVANGRADILQILLDILAETSAEYCVVGGLAVNAYVEPVVSLDLDIVIATSAIEIVIAVAEQRGLKVEWFEHSVNIKSPQSDLRIQLQTDPQYQDFIPRTGLKDVLGYRMNVACIEDVLQGKVWAYLDQTQRKSKRQKDLADMLRIIESFPHLADSLPPEVHEKLED